MTIEAGQIFKDNDPRMNTRLVTVREVREDYAVCVVNGTTRETTISLKRMFTDGKPRRTGFSLVV